jgi:hypothetical protein
MGEKQNGPFRLSFNAWSKVDFHGSRVASDGGLVLARELDIGWAKRRGQEKRFPKTAIRRSKIGGP